MNAKIRSSVSSDLPAAKKIIDAVELFPSELLDGMFNAGTDDDPSTEFWITVDVGEPVAMAYCAPEPMTEGTWNVLLIAVHPEHQGMGIGRQLMSTIESRLTRNGARILLVETSGNDDFAGPRDFYARLGYDEEARIREYYDVDNDKIVFHKKL